MKKLLFIPLLVLIFLTACGNHTRTQLTVQTTDELSQVLDTAFARRLDVISTQPTAEDLTRFTEGRRPMQIVRPWALGTATRGDMDAVVTQTNALRDTTALFDMLATEYILYIYFGGDEVFFPVRDRIKEYINNQPYWYVWELGELFHTHLSTVIFDNHAVIGGHQLGIRYGFVVADIRFESARDGFRNLESGLYVAGFLLPCLPRKVLSIGTVLHFSMDESGASFFYSPVIALQVPDTGLPRYLTIIYTDDTEETLPLYVWDNGEPPVRDMRIESSLEFIQGIPVTAITVMGNPDGPEDSASANAARQFVLYANQLRREPIIVVDIRSNRGGTMTLQRRWFSRALGETPAPTNTELELTTNEDRRWLFWVESQRRRGHNVSNHNISHFFDNNHFVWYGQEELIQSDKLLILLVDRLSASAAEGMVSRVLGIENTLIIGQYTNGVYIASGGQDMFLPRSGISFRFGQHVFVHPQDHFTEGRGFAPDIWVTGCALTATINMLNNHIIRE